MSGDVQILTLERNEGLERLAVRFLDDGQRHAVELAIERRTIEGWTLHKRIVVRLSEVFQVNDAIERACALAKAVRR